MLGKIQLNGTLIGILYNEEQYIKLGLKNLASQVLDQDTVEFEISGQLGIVTRIISRKRQPFIGIVSKITPKNIYINLPLLNPYSSIPYTTISGNKNISVGTKGVGWISLETFHVSEFYENNKDLVRGYYNEIRRLDISNNVLTLDSPNKNNIKDLTNLNTFHIDPSGCVDVDDFMSIDQNQKKIYIHIIDITQYISLNQDKDLEQRKYGYTWYFPDFTLHLDSDLVKDISRDIYCITLEIDLQDTNKKLSLYQSKIRCKFDLTYQQAQEIFDGGVHPLRDDLIWSLDKIELQNPSPYRRKYWRYNENKLQIEFEDECLAHRYVSGWMIYYNSWIAENYSVPQRVHPETKLFKLQFIKELPLEVQYIMYVKQMRQAEYKGDSLGHFGLNKKYYTHATSPLRRYFDRIIQYILLGELKECHEQLLEHLNCMERISERVRDWYDKQLTFQYIDENNGKLWDAYIVKINPSGMEIYIYEIQEFIWIRRDEIQEYKLGDKIDIYLELKNNGINPILKSF